MFIHLGGSRMIRIREVVAILDAGAAEQAANETHFVQIAKNEGRMEHISPDEIKSYVITKDRVFASPISSTTLKKRADQSQKSWK
ncbi:extracellular matrix regulator RemB [Laceyella putida]|uniref:Extracellular matrix regulator RemB n=1 Tax=Laceyella putida TaxID=110101 RepID=A0ABW2RGV1_9BACL